MRKVRIGAGLEWLREASGIVRAHPAEFLGMGAIMTVIAVIPLLGSLVMLFLGPALIAGTIHAAHQAAQARKPRIGQLFQVFQEGDRVGSYIALCLPLLGAGIVLAIMLHNAGITAQMLSDPKALQATMEAFFGTGKGVVFLLVAIVVMLIAGMLTFLATPSILLDRKPAFVAMKNSFRACAGNFGAFFIALFLLGLGIQILHLLLGLLLPNLLATVLAYTPYYALVGPLAYVAYRSIFSNPEADAAGPASSQPPPPPTRHSFEA
jgi:hypothetical protein